MNKKHLFQKNVVDNAPCIFILNTNSQMKVYSGPMFWNKIDMDIHYPRNDFVSQNLFHHALNENNLETILCNFFFGRV